MAVDSSTRSGFSVVRICNDCGERIADGDACKCPRTTAFVREAAITICRKADGEPIRLAKVSRLGNGAFRVEGSGHWYGFDGQPAHDKDATRGTIARPRRPDDVVLIDLRRSSHEEAHAMIAVNRERNGQRTAESTALSEAARGRREARAHSASADSIDPEEYGERCRVAGIEKARKEQEGLRALAARWVAHTEDATKRAAAARARNDALKPKIESLPADARTMLDAENAEALARHFYERGLSAFRERTGQDSVTTEPHG